MVGLILLSSLGIGIIFIVIFLRHVYNSTREKPLFNKKQARQIAFYEKCLEMKIYDLKKWANFQKAQQVAQDLNLEDDWIDTNTNPETAFNAYFDEAKKLYTENLDAIRQKQLDEQRKAEIEQEKQLTKYADCTGTYKRIAMLTDMEREYDTGARLLHEYSLSLSSGVQQPTCDWAIIGGLISGLAGGAAGLAAAANVQMHNAQIRAQNARNMERIANNVYEVSLAAARLSAKAEDLYGEIYEAERKSVKEISEEDVMKLLSFENSRVEVRETGAITISVTVKCQKSGFGFNKNKMVIDGTIGAEIYESGKLVKTARLVLPVYGLAEKCDLTTICCANADPVKTYEIRFVPYHLWMIEK